MRTLLASTGLAAVIVILAAGTARGETTVATKLTNGVRTSTIKAGAPDDIRITSAGSVVPTGGVGVLLDSTNKVTNEGTIQITNADGATGIAALAGGSGTITNAGGAKIIVDETYAPTDADKDGDLDGPLANGANRFGIRTAGAFTGDVINNGSIAIEGKDSAGIQLDGPLTGKLTTDGTVNVIGDRSVGVRAGDVSGPVRIAGTVSAQGQGAKAVSFEGNLAGALVVQGTVVATGYRNTTPPADVTKLDADDLLQGGPALSIAGDVAGGVILAVPPEDKSSTDDDEDKDGIKDSAEGSANVTAFGSAAAVQVGAAARDVTIGAVAGSGDGHGLVIDGDVLGAGTYAGVDGNGVVIGGQGGKVTVAGGMTVGGQVRATSLDRNATAIRIGDGATVNDIKVSGAVGAAGGGGAGAKTTAIAIDAGATVATIRNSGTVQAVAGGDKGDAAAIVDRSGKVVLVSNSGTVTAKGGATNIAVDLSANATGAQVRQTVVTSGTAPSITGDVVFGSGNDRFDIADGSVSGAAKFGGGSNIMAVSGDATYAGAASFGAGDDTINLGGTASFAGSADFGGGTDSLTLAGTSRFTGTLANAQGLAVALNGGTLDIGKSSATIRTLSIGQAGNLVVTIDGATKTNTLYQVSGEAAFAAGAKVTVKLASVKDAVGRFVFVRAGSVTGAGNLASDDALLPFMYKSAVAAGAPGEVAIDIKRKTTGELGLNRSQAAAYDAIYTALAGDTKVAGVFLDTTDGSQFRKQIRQMLPDHAGGAFEAVTLGSRATAGFLADPNAPFVDEGSWGYWLQQVGWGTAKSLGDTASYDITGWGVATGGEIKTGSLGNFGLSLAYLNGKDGDGGTANEVRSNQYEVGLYWRGEWGRLSTWARTSYGFIDFKGRREFKGSVGGETLERKMRSDWGGRLVSASGGASYDFAFGSFSLRPVLAVDYYRLREKGHDEKGGGSALDLIVDSRTSDELAVSGTVAAGYNFGGDDADAGWFRLELEGGRRQLVGGGLGDTRAHFAGGETFTLVPEDRTSGWVGKFRASGGGNGLRIAGEAGAEQQQGRAAITLRASLMIGF